MSQRTQDRHTLHIPMPIWSLSVCIFGNLPAKPSFLKRLPESHPVFLKWQSFKVAHSSFPERWRNDESHAIALVLRNRIQFKVYFLDWDSVWCIHCPVKMTTEHFTTASHNFAQCGVIDHDQMATVTLQTTYDPTLSCVNPKVVCPLKIFPRFWIFSDVVSHLPAAQYRPVHCVDVGYRDVITQSCASRGHHYDAPPIFRVKKSLLPPTIHFS